MSDALTTAYLAMAYQRATLNQRKAAHQTAEGEIGTIETLISYADDIDAVFDARAKDEGWSGVFCHDVVAPMGDYIMRELGLGNIPTSSEVVCMTDTLFGKHAEE